VTLKPLNLNKFSVPDVTQFKQEIEHLKANNLTLPIAIYIIPFLSIPTGITYSFETTMELIN